MTALAGTTRSLKRFDSLSDTNTRQPHFRMRICTVVGARPQFVKAAAVSPALRAAGIGEVLVHTGQHYDAALSQIFFDELNIPSPNANLAVGSGSHAHQTGRIMERLETFINESGPFDAVLLYGDTNSTAAGALVAAKACIPVAHVEAGIRSFNRTMPEEVNRVITDCLSRWLFAPTRVAMDNLNAEGLGHHAELVGDVMLDATRMFSRRAAERFPLHEVTAYAPQSYALATIHRPSNTDVPGCLESIFSAFRQLPWPVILPLHPRTQTRMDGITVPANVHIIKPVSYLAMLTLIGNAKRILTDSGGLQKEAYWLEVPCVTLRIDTEWPQTFEHGWNTCVGADKEAIVRSALAEPTGPQRPLGEAPDGKTASETIAAALVRDL